MAASVTSAATAMSRVVVASYPRVPNSSSAARRMSACSSVLERRDLTARPVICCPPFSRQRPRPLTVATATLRGARPLSRPRVEGSHQHDHRGEPRPYRPHVPRRSAVTTPGAYDPFDGSFREDPYPAFTQLREQCPVHRYELPAAEVEKINANPIVARPTREFYSISRYADVLAGVQDNATFASGQGPGPERAMPPDGVGMLISADEPHHARQRRIVVQAFNPRAIAALRPELEKICQQLVDGFEADGRVDLVPAYATPTPIEALSLILGVSASDRDKFKRWTDDTLKAFGGDPEAYERSYQSL